MEEAKFNPSSFINRNTGELRQKYILKESIGEGAFGSVRKAILKGSDQERAIKTMKKSMIAKQEGGIQLLKQEISILKQMDHPNILRLFEFYEDNINFHLITELCTGGELFDKIIENGYLNEKLCASYMQQVLSGINYCHQKNIVHRDLKPENLILENNKSDAQIKIIDFGTSQAFDPDKIMKTQVGTPYYIAPEVILGKYNQKVDIWSCGVIMFVILSGYPPFQGETDQEILSKVKEGKLKFDDAVWKKVSKEAKECISYMLTKDINKRPTAQEVLEHKWFEKFLKVDKIGDKVILDSLQRLKKFKGDQKLQTAIITFIANQFVNNEEREKLGKIFKQLDTDNNGKLSREELMNGYRTYMSELDAENEVNEILKKADIDGSGEIDFTEFIATTMDQRKLLSTANIENAFNAFDIDSSQTISLNELKHMLGNAVQDTTLETVFAQVDTDGNGEIDLEEFKMFLNKLF